VRLALDTGWSAEPVSRTFEKVPAGQQQPLPFEVKPAPGPDPPAQLRGVARVGDRQIGVGMLVISHPPLPPLTVFPPAVVKLVRVEVRTTAHKIGYVMGAGDEMPAAIRDSYQYFTKSEVDNLRKAGYNASFTPLEQAVNCYVTDYLDRPDRYR